MHEIINFIQKFPDNWNDETVYSNKKLVSQTPEKDYVHKHKKLKKLEDGTFEETDEEVVYHGLIQEIWEYDCPGNLATGKWGLNVFKCPRCGSYELKIEEYDHLQPEALAGSAGVYYICEKCGYTYNNMQIHS